MIRGFHQLGLGDRCGHTQDRLVREEYRAFWHSMDVAGEAQGLQRSEEILAEATGRRQPFQVRRSKAHLLEKHQHLLQSCRKQKAASRAQPAREKLEYGAVVHCGIVIALHEGELMAVGQQNADAGIHAASPPTTMACAPSFAISSSARSPSPGSISLARIASLSKHTA
jgi:hypothetical protein